MSVDNPDVDEASLKLQKACKKGDFEYVANFFQTHSSYNVDIKDEQGGTCLHDTAVHTCQFVSITKLLLEHGASVNIKDNEGNTPLHSAVLFHCVENVKLMMGYNADLSLVNHNNVSAIDFAENAEDAEILRLLLGKKFVETEASTKSKSKQKKASRLRKFKTFLPIPPIDSPSILKKRKRCKLEENINLTHEENENSCKRVKFKLPQE